MRSGALHYGLAPLKGPDWSPPGVWPEIDGIGPLHPEIWPVKSGSFASPRDDKASMLVVADALATASIAAASSRGSWPHLPRPAGFTKRIEAQP
jgi:hypothetical protein